MTRGLMLPGRVCLDSIGWGSMGESRTSKAIGLIALEVPQIVLKRILSESMDLLYQNCARNCAYTFKSAPLLAN